MNKRSRNYKRLIFSKKTSFTWNFTAGLMHELNNPGTAASRAAMQTRESEPNAFAGENFRRKSPVRSRCSASWVLQERAMMAVANVHGSLEQADAEDAVAQWLTPMM